MAKTMGMAKSTALPWRMMAIPRHSTGMAKTMERHGYGAGSRHGSEILEVRSQPYLDLERAVPDRGS